MTFLIRGAFFYGPAGFDFFILFLFSGEQEEHLPFRMDRDPSPSLFVAVYSLEGSAQQFSHLLLRLAQFLTNVYKFLLLDMSLPKAILGLKPYPVCAIYTMSQCGPHNQQKTPFPPERERGFAGKGLLRLRDYPI